MTDDQPPASLPLPIRHSSFAIPPTAPRLPSIDFLRGLVMVLMALDHTRGMVSGAPFDPTDLSHPNPALFLTRWSTHFCAPVFVFLAGTAAFLFTTRGKTKAELSYFLVTRGLWLILLEFTLVRFGWSFHFFSPYIVGQVIWVLGCSMMVLAGLVHLPILAVALFGIAIIGLHNLLDDVQAKSFGDFAWLWGILHGGYNFKLLPGLEFRPSYALVPWVGVMATGYSFGSLLLLEPRRRRPTLLWLGLGLCAAFVLIRAINVYGDPAHWAIQNNLLLTCFSFVNCTKYPPSLQFLLMTIGPGILLLGVLGRVNLPGNSSSPSLSPGSKYSFLTRPFIILGRVPMFYYLLHLPLIHLLAVVVSLPHYRLALGSFYYARPPVDSGYGHDLWVVYFVWLLAVVLLFPLCKWFARVKQQHRQTWLSYL